MALRTSWEGEAELLLENGRVLAVLQLALMYQPEAQPPGDAILRGRWRILSAIVTGRASAHLRSYEGQTLTLRLSDGFESAVTLLDGSAQYLRLVRSGARPLFDTAQS
jgi:hypothetical protein